jgi:hypothetical protein
MAFPSTSESATSLAVMIPEIWGERINDFFKSKLVLADFFVNRSQELSGGGDTLYTPGLTEMSANSKTNATAVNYGGLIMRLKQSIINLYEMLYLSKNNTQIA